VPFGGVKDSGYGSEGGSEAIEACTSTPNSSARSTSDVIRVQIYLAPHPITAHLRLADYVDLCEHRYILTEITLQAGWHNMGHPISPDRALNGSAVNLFEPAGAGSVPIFLKQSLLPKVPERELALRVEQILAPASRSRRKIWEFDSNLHCSIIGTCLTNAELRQVLVKLGLREAATATEHDLHVSGVLLAGKHHEGAKLLHKALDRRHRVAINQFARAKSTDEVRVYWLEAVQRGEIPGAYWAALTHAATNDALVREVFSQVHMLSHLVGAANRADIRRLRQLEAENTELDAKVARQQQQLRDAIVSRDATIRELHRTLEERLPRDGESGVGCLPGSDGEVWRGRCRGRRDHPWGGPDFTLCRRAAGADRASAGARRTVRCGISAP
jgi:hypothetical protein